MTRDSGVASGSSRLATTRLKDVAFGEDAGQPAVVEDQHGANPGFGHRDMASRTVMVSGALRTFWRAMISRMLRFGMMSPSSVVSYESILGESTGSVRKGFGRPIFERLSPTASERPEAPMMTMPASASVSDRWLNTRMPSRVAQISCT